MGSTDIPVSAEVAVRRWRTFADRTRFTAPNGLSITWFEYLKRNHTGKADERSIVGPIVFPVFAAQILGFVVGQSLAAEVSSTEGRPDFTPADAITHPFVFEVKGTDGGDALAGHTEQVTRYLQQGRNRIKRVVLTNLWGLRVFDLDAADGLREVMHVDLRLLSIIPEAAAVAHPHAQALARFLNEFRFQSLTIEQKIERVRTAPPWNPGLEVTQPAWVL